MTDNNKKQSNTTEKEDLTITEMESLLKISNLKESEGGQELIKNLKDDIWSEVMKLMVIYPKASLNELIAIIAKIDALDDLLEQLKDAEAKYQSLKDEVEGNRYTDH